MRILVVCQYYYPENFQITPICEELAKRGHQITVLTGLPNYPTGIVPNEYKKGHRDEFVNGVHVIRCKEHGRKKGILHLALNYLSFYRSAKRKIKKLNGDYDLVFAYQLSPVFMGVPAKLFAKLHNIPLIVYCCDLWPESLKVYINNEGNPIFRFAKKVSRELYQSADRIIAQSTSFVDYLISVHNIKKSNILYIPAFSEETYLSQDFETKNEDVVFSFIGNIGVAQDLLKVLKAVEKIKEITGFKVYFIGDGSMLSKLKEYVADHGLNDIVVFYGRHPVEEMPVFYKQTDVCLLSLKSDSAIGLTLPTKIQGYMAAGKPILGMINGSAKAVIEEANCGICVDAGDVDGLSKAMKYLINHRNEFHTYGSNSRSYFVNHFRKQTVIDSLEKELLSFAKEQI